MGTFANILERSKQSEWLFLDTSIMRSTYLSVVTDAGGTAKPFIPFSMAKGFNFAEGMSLLMPCITRNLGHRDRDGSSVFEERSIFNAREIHL